ASRSLIDVSPGVARTARSQLSACGENDDVTVRLGSLGRRLDALELLQAEVHDLPLDRGHRLELDAAAGVEHLAGRAHGERLERRAPSLPVAGRVDDDF